VGVLALLDAPALVSNACSLDSCKSSVEILKGSREQDEGLDMRLGNTDLHTSWVNLVDDLADVLRPVK